ncbi:MAG: DEAD/DEAH box helicase [Actinobacteria bacterium]|nr:DEAD/DEAH box helicase [Actinomycetota bacterium]MBU4365169.1 DEAD/DEAH box helicase [Actinomycetota bacterium]MBU4417747.1 DEAD/DEAH box helicase [Actinomycetota bacterium]MBU4586812.1 DEAD/DEAH box helicase [Actinomycetota bacterium]
MDAEVLERFSVATREWFTSSFAAPTPAQLGAWKAISSGEHTLVVAPTGSGKTLSAFLWALDRLATQPPPDRSRRCRVLYISPLKALAVDVERNLRVPLAGIGEAAHRLGLEPPNVRVAVRSGDTPTEERRAFAREPADILITTPESLFLLLTSAAREALASIETVIIDEVHALAGTKRGAHLALSLERLDALLAQPAQRVGLSATVRPIEEVARFLAGGRPVTQVAPPSQKRWDLSVVVPVPDLAELGTNDSGPSQHSSIWPHVEERIVDQVAAHHATLIFVNSRRLAERLTARLNEIWLERLEAAPVDLPEHPKQFPEHPKQFPEHPKQFPEHPEQFPEHPKQFPELVEGSRRAPAEVMAQSAIARGAPPVLARAHHGSVSREQRQLVEAELKAGLLPAVVATSSLELGIDMGAIDLVIQVESPPSVASGLQRVGRAGHQVGAVSRGVLYPKFRGDLVQTAVAVEQMLAGQIESLQVPANPLDVLAQQIVAMVAMDEWSVSEVETLVRRSAPFATLTPAVLAAVLDMLAGRYPSEDFAELRPRLTWDRATDTLTGRRSAQRLAVTSGGTIPDRGLYGVFLSADEAPDSAGRRVGELDEEMVYESRVGDVIALGTSSWRIIDITHDRVLVAPAPGQAARLPFWKGDSLGRPAELGRAVGAFVREVSALSTPKAKVRLAKLGLDEWAIDNLLNYLNEQSESMGRLPHDRQIVVERFRDELGDWRVVVHSPFGAQVHAPWALIVAARLRERFGVDVQAMHADDGLVFRLPDTGWDDESGLPGATSEAGSALAELLELIFPDPEAVAAQVTEQLGGSALFAARFRECAGRALLLPNRRPGRRQALWQQRLRSSQLLQVASAYPSFPIVLEAVRECVNDVFDVPGLVELLGEVRSRKVATVAVDTSHPSPFASSLQFGYIAQFLYDADSPLAERRAAALSLDPQLLAELLGTAEGLALADLLDPDALTATELELAHLTEGRKARDAEDVTDLLRMLGPLTTAGLAARTREPTALGGWLAELIAKGLILELPGDRWVAIEDAARARDGLGMQLPHWVPEAFLAPSADPIGELLTRYARSHTVFTAGEAAVWLGIGPTVAREALRRLVSVGRLVEGELSPPGWRPPTSSLSPTPSSLSPTPSSLSSSKGHAEASTSSANWDGSPSPVPQFPEPVEGSKPHPAPVEATGPQFCDAGVLRILRRRSLAALRHSVEPVSAVDFARFLPSWQGLGQRRGVDGVLQVADQLAGLPLPASALESLILPARVVDYVPAMLDELTASGELLWQGHGTIGGNDGWLSLHPAATAATTLTAPTEPPTAEAAAVVELLGSGGHFFLRLAEQCELPETRLTELLWELAWSGRVTNDTFAGLRALLTAGASAHRRRPQPARGRHRPALTAAALRRRLAPPQAAGRWSVLPEPETDPTARAVARAELLLERYGILTRGSVAAEEVPGGFAGIYRVLAAAEEAGRIRRGYFIEGLGAAQFGDTGAVDRLRVQHNELGQGLPEQAVVLAATDPANPYGAALGWPPRSQSGHLPARKAGALVVLIAGRLVLYVERGGRTLLSWTDEPILLEPAAVALAEAVHAGVLGRLTVTKVDGQAALGSSQPLAQALAKAGFGLTPQGLRLRR